ncbi:hypothetical protein BN2537_6573 [Streptomyces venezuelae]|nr:hypothetical protein BN2537_6573 [Streptomyces venezuelae]
MTEDISRKTTNTPRKGNRNIDGFRSFTPLRAQNRAGGNAVVPSGPVVRGADQPL